MEVFLNTVGVLLDLHVVYLVTLVIGSQFLPFAISVIQWHRLHDLVNQRIVPGLVVHRKGSLDDRVSV